MIKYRVIINDCPIAVGVGDVVECTASLITRVRLVSPIGGAPGGSGNLSTSLSNDCGGTSKFVWVFNANCDATIIYNNLYILLLYREQLEYFFSIIDSKN
jgi:hypothetical protein